jgi:DNA mismatch endonuclease (patch repair protein)
VLANEFTVASWILQYAPRFQLIVMTRHRPPTTTETSARMRTIRTARTQPEREVEKVLRRLRLRFRRNVGDLPGKPDFLLIDYHLIVNVDGCFWHGCPRCFSGTRRNKKWWDRKIEENRRRDRRIDAQLRRRGYHVMHVWEHDSLSRVETRLLSMCRGTGAAVKRHR